MHDSIIEKNLAVLRAQTLGDPAVCVAVLDGPVDLSHPCFAGARLSVVETVVPNAAGDDGASRHGTHVASVVFGLAPGCRGLIVPVFSPGESLGCPQLELARAIEQACDHGAQVINVSAGELTEHGIPDAFLQAALQRCARDGVLIVAAAGNDGCACLHVPAAVDSVLAVGALDGSGRPLASSNWAASYRSHGILAAGEDVPGALPGGGLTVRTGTSFAAAVVSGVAALLLSLQRQRGQEPDPRRVRAALLA
ncbi:MAG: S8 family serine peptidase, partial [Thermoanaerobaculia bacterium]